MRAVQRDVPGAILMDTGPAALWGILEDERAAAHREEGFILINVGNQHTLGVLLRGERILGLFEHHTVLLDAEKVQRLIRGLRAGTLTNDEVYADNGHGAYVHPDYVPREGYSNEGYPGEGAPGGGFEFVAVTGPKREMVEDLGYVFAAPYGDMMLTGCFGLVADTRRLLGGTSHGRESGQELSD